MLAVEMDYAFSDDSLQTWSTRYIRSAHNKTSPNDVSSGVIRFGGNLPHVSLRMCEQMGFISWCE